jgi:hypothetical protein
VTELAPGAARAGSHQHLQAMGASAAGFWEKPFDWPSLIATIYDAVRPVRDRPGINRDDLSDPASA